MDIYVSTQLTAKEMEKLDDGQGWYKPGDEVFIGGYVGEWTASFSLDVNGDLVCDNWTHWYDLPKAIQNRLSRANVKAWSGDSISKSASDLGRKGGSVKSERKSQASRENGRKGGRPAK